jgi:hypothetical protein
MIKHGEPSVSAATYQTSTERGSYFMASAVLRS